VLRFTRATSSDLPWVSDPLKMSQFIPQRINAVLSGGMLPDKSGPAAGARFYCVALPYFTTLNVVIGR
jgi:hypothetical protein